MKMQLARFAITALGASWILPAMAQDPDVTAATVGTCNLHGAVKVTLLGNTTTTPLPCVNPTGEDQPGMDEDEIAGTTTVGVPAVASVAAVSAPYGASGYLDETGTTTLAAVKRVDHASAMQGQILTGGVFGGMYCESGGGTVSCKADTRIASLIVGGQAVMLPADPIPMNYTIPLANLVLAVNVLGIGVVNVPVSGAVVLNKVTIKGTLTHPAVEHVLFEVQLNGQVSLLGLGLLGVDVTVVDQDLIEFAVNNGYVAVAASTIQPGVNQSICEIFRKVAVEQGVTPSPCPYPQ